MAVYEPGGTMSFEQTAAPHPDDTIVAVSSAPGPGARAIVRVSGPKTRDVIDAVFAPTAGMNPAARHLVPGSVRLTGVHSPLPADLYYFRGPRSYTGQDLAELHTVGSPPLVERLVADLLTAGGRPARPGEFTLRAFLAGKKDLPQAEAVQAVVEAGTDADLTAALAQLAGGVTQPLHALREDLLNLLADVEAALDFADEDVEFVGKTETLTRIAAALARLTNLQRQLDSRTVSGRPIRVALVGLPNAGKSSLFNALAGGPAALVSPEAGTTRDYLTRTLDLGGVPVELIDTAGWQDGADTIAEQAQRLGREQAARADVILWCVEPGGPFDPADEARLRATGAEVLRVETKADLASRAGHGTGLVANRVPDDVPNNPPVYTGGSPVPVSVIAPGGTDALRAALTDGVLSLARPPLAPSQSRCRHHVEACIARLREAHRHAVLDDPPELLALALRSALDPLGEMVGAVYTNDLLDRIFSRFCIGK
jgi:tRNA modification GTPase